MSVKKDHARARAAQIVAEEKTSKKVERVIEEGLVCPRCHAPARAVAQDPFNVYAIGCTRPLSECSFAHDYTVESPGVQRAEVTAAIVADLAKLDPRTKPPEARSKHDLAGSADAGKARLLELADKLGKVHGNKTTALVLEKASVADVMTIPWGILMLDLKTRGIRVGRVNRLHGPKSTLKSTLCLRVLRQAQRHCRHCKFPIVMDPDTGQRDCRCPNPRYWLKNEADYAWLPSDAAIELAYGRLPEGAKKVKVPGEGTFMALECAPPVHLVEAEEQKAAEAEAKAKSKKKDGPKKERKKLTKRAVCLVETTRCEPMRCLYLDGEHTIDKAWAKANGVDTELVLLVGAEWAEASYGSLEDAILTREFDVIIIDSTSVLEPKTNIEKTLEDNPTVAARANIQGRFVRRYLSASFEGLNARHRPTILATSQMSMHGIGYMQHAHLAPTDGNAWDHALTLDIKMTEEGYTFDPTKQFAIFGQFGFEVKKDKTGGEQGSCVGATGSINFWLRSWDGHQVGDSDDLAIVMSYARELGRRTPGTFITETGSKFVLYSPFLKASGGSRSFSRVGDLEQFIKDNTTVYDDLRERVLSALRQDQAALAAIGASKKK